MISYLLVVEQHRTQIDRKSGSAGMPRSEERFSRNAEIGRAVHRNAETDLVCRLLLEKKNKARPRAWRSAPRAAPNMATTARRIGGRRCATKWRPTSRVT